MRIYGFYNCEGSYPNLLLPIFEEDKSYYYQLIRDNQFVKLLPIDVANLDSRHMFVNTSPCKADPEIIKYAFATRDRDIYYSDKVEMQKTVKDNLPFADTDSLSYSRLSAFAYSSSEDPAQ